MEAGATSSVFLQDEIVKAVITAKKNKVIFCIIVLFKISSSKVEKVLVIEMANN